MSSEQRPFRAFASWCKCRAVQLLIEGDGVSARAFLQAASWVLDMEADMILKGELI